MPYNLFWWTWKSFLLVYRGVILKFQFFYLLKGKVKKAPTTPNPKGTQALTWGFFTNIL